MRIAIRLSSLMALALIFAPSAFAQPCPVSYGKALGKAPTWAPALKAGTQPPVGSWVAVAATFYSAGDSPGTFHVNGQSLNPREYPCTFAELSVANYDFSAMGNLADGTLMAAYCPRTRKRVMLVKRDVGRGGVGAEGLQRAFDFWNAGSVQNSAAKLCGAAGIFKIFIMRLPAKAANGGLQPDYGTRARWDGQVDRKNPPAKSKPKPAVTNQPTEVQTQPYKFPLEAPATTVPTLTTATESDKHHPDVLLWVIIGLIAFLFFTRPSKNS